MKKIILLMLVFLSYKSSIASDLYRVETERLNIRATPGSKGKLVGYIPFGENVKVLDSTNSRWFKVKVTNGTGYVNSSFLKKIPEVNNMDGSSHNLKVAGVVMLIVLLVVCFYYLFKPKRDTSISYPLDNYPQQIIIQRKSVALAILLSFIFGPFGMFYSTIRGAIAMILLPVFGVLFFMIAQINSYELMGSLILLGLLIFLCFYWLICIIWSAISASNANKIVINSNYNNEK